MTIDCRLVSGSELTVSNRILNFLLIVLNYLFVGIVGQVAGAVINDLLLRIYIIFILRVQQQGKTAKNNEEYFFHAKKFCGHKQK
jgi:hypothetical protein